jgi:hypothetical protein
MTTIDPTLGNDTTTSRNHRFPDGLYEAAQAKAAAEGRTMTDILTRALWNFVDVPRTFRPPVRNVLKEESQPYTHITVRTYYEDGKFLSHTMYVWGGRGRDYATDRGLISAIARRADERAGREGEKRGEPVDTWNLDAVHARLAARVEAGEVPWGYVAAEV